MINIILSIPVAQISEAPPPKEVPKSKSSDLDRSKNSHDFSTVVRDHLAKEEAKAKVEEISTSEEKTVEKEKGKSSPSRIDLILPQHLVLALQDTLDVEDDLQAVFELAGVATEGAEVTFPIEGISQSEFDNLMGNLNADAETFLDELNLLFGLELEDKSEEEISFETNVAEMNLIETDVNSEKNTTLQTVFEPQLEEKVESTIFDQEETQTVFETPSQTEERGTEVTTEVKVSEPNFQPGEQTLRQRNATKNFTLGQEPSGNSSETLVVKGRNGIPLFLSEESSPVVEEPVENLDVQTALQDFVSTVKLKVSLPKPPTAAQITELESKFQFESAFEQDTELESQVSATEQSPEESFVIDRVLKEVPMELKKSAERNFENLFVNANSEVSQGSSNFEQIEFEQLTNKVLDLQEQETLVPKLVQNIQSLVQADRSEVRIDLKPDHLGELKIKLSLERGIMVAEFTVESEAVQAVLASELPQLQTALQDQGANVAEMMVNIGFGQKEQNDDGESKPKHFASQSRAGVQTGRITAEGEENKLGKTKWNQVDVKV